MPAYIAADMNAQHTALGHGTCNFKGRMINDLVRRDMATFLGPNFPTFIGARAGKPDIILANRLAHLNYAIQSGDLTSSDHIPLILTLATKGIAIPITPRPCTKRANWDGFQAHCNREVGRLQINDEDIVKNAQYADQRINDWYELVKEAGRENIPMTWFRILEAPIDSDRLKQLQLRFDLIHTQAARTGWNRALLLGVREIQGLITEESVRLHTEYWNSRIRNVDLSYGQEGRFWDSIARLLGKSSNGSPYILHNNDKIFKDEDKEPVFREYWSNVFRITPEENANFDRNHETMVNDVLRRRGQELVPYPTVDLTRLDPNNPLTRPFELDEIKEIIKNGKRRKAPGKSNINRCILSHLPDTMLEVFRDINNEAYSMGYYLLLHKIGTICFIPKQGKDTKLVNNYRPITLLEMPGKIIERVLKNRVVEFFETNNLMNNNQYGFTKNRGTQNAVTVLYETIAMAQAKNYGCNVVSRDVAKAFDKVWHNGLKYKILLTEMDDLTKRMLCSYLDGRRAQIRVGKVTGEEFPILSGVPQGGVLAPILFNFYTRDTPAPGIGCTQILFADDHTQIITYPGPRGKAMLARKTANEITRVNNYERLWKIATSQEKFQLLSVSATKPKDVKVDNNIIPYKPHIKILGVTIGKRGTKEHALNCAKKAKSTATRLRRFRNASTKTNMLLFKMLVRPQMEYPAALFAPMSKASMNKIQAVQNKCLRRICKERPPYNNTIKTLHERHNLETMNCRIHRLATKTWEKTGNINDTTTKSRELSTSDWWRKDHGYWPRIEPKIRGNPPRPRYIGTD